MIQLCILHGAVQMIGFLVVRVSRPGRICSGDYLTKDETANLQYYQTFEGVFIYIVAAFQIVVFVVTFVFYRLLVGVVRIVKQ